jgi:(hydroxyamino)benzene mutase
MSWPDNRHHRADFSGATAPGGGDRDGQPARHPADPEPARASKARAVWWLGLTSLLTGPLVGGLVPAAVALMLAGQFRREAYHSEGFLTGAALVRRGERLAWGGVTLAVAALVTAVVVGLLQVAAGPPGPTFPPHVD